MHQHQPYTQAGQQVEIMNKLDKLSVGHHFTAKSNDKDLAAECIDVGCHRAEPGHKVGAGLTL